jgi:ATP phosphoribosyltransferase
MRTRRERATPSRTWTGQACHRTSDEREKRQTVHDLIDELEQAYTKDQFGKYWMSAAKCKAVDKLESLHRMERTTIMKQIFSLADVEEKWTVALSFSQLTIGMRHSCL